MPLQASFFKRVFQFNFKARTSRGLMKDKTSWFIKIFDPADPAKFGLGEAGPLPGLSMDYSPDFEDKISNVVQKFNEAGVTDPGEGRFLAAIPPDLPSIAFAFETALLDLLNGGKRVIYKNSFLEGKAIPINGLVWMGDMDFIMTQINQKIEQGFSCIKLKVGGLDFDRECDTLHYIRKRYFRDNVTIRLDANGGFKIDTVLYKLEELAKFSVHSIEQPLKAGMAETRELCKKSPIPVALDEELIGKTTRMDKENLLRDIKPQFIVLKPTLHGGLRGCAEWISIAQSLGIGYWMTSALESSIGLNAICQFTANYEITIPQGLGTGMIYQNNFESPLNVKNGFISYDPELKWDADLATL
jgi:o-succinylbenzoate synthase